MQCTVSNDFACAVGVHWELSTMQFQEDLKNIPLIRILAVDAISAEMCQDPVQLLG